MRLAKKKCIKKYNTTELDYFNNLYSKTQKQIIDIENQIENNINSDIPLRFKFLLSDISIENKRAIINKLNEFNKIYDKSGEYFKYYKLINVISKLPLGIYYNININKKDNYISNYLNNIKDELDKKIYGHTETKEQIIRILAQYISNPNANGYIIGIQGSMGIGKTKLIKDGIAKVLQCPFAFIPLGGISDASYLKGHLYTYEGSTHGKIVEEIIKAKVMNPVFFFDELDKISSTSHGDEIVNTLIHITDPTQNNNFTDKYLEDISLDLSKSLIFFTFNDLDEINPILKDRMIIIKANNYTLNDKIKLTKNYLLEDISKSYNFNLNDIIISDENIEYIINKTTQEDGVRNLLRNINNIYSHINMNKYIKINDKLIDFPFTITKSFIDKYIIMKREDNLINLSLYL
jgi:ATP-dependent Lon protease